MTLKTYQTKINEQKELDIYYENLVDLLKYYVLFAQISQLSFFEYDYEYNDYSYSFSVDKNDKIFKENHEKTIFQDDISIILEEDGTIYGMLSISQTPKSSSVVDELFSKIIILLKKIFNIKKDLLSQESKLELYIISDEKSKNFANKLLNNLDILLNVSISIESSVISIVEKLKEKTKKSILIYTVDDEDLLDTDKELLNGLNEFIVVIGPSDYNLSLYCGHLCVYKYLSKDEFVPEKLKVIIEELKNKTQNKYIHKNKIIAVSGIAGGIGTTTISMNMANMLAKKNPDKNTLYIDLSNTKAISNLFLSQNPLPTKTIIDLVNSNEFDIELNLKNGLEKIRENFYAINGIQKHIDSDFLEQDVFIEKLLGYLAHMGDQFNFIIIDTGESNASVLNTTIYDISNELWILTEMSLPHISKLKTFFTLMKRAGLKDKLTFLVNRYDSVNAISVSDVTSILNTANEDHLNFDFKIPNDYTTLGHCWNYCELASSTHPKSIFVKKLEKILLDREFFKDIKKVEHTKRPSLLNFLKIKK